jgi:ABC-2 type transport system permease protein
MTVTAVTTPIERPQRSALGWAVSDTKAITWRNLVTLRRTPQLLVFSTIQPVIFVLMFRYVFGGAIHIPGVDYVNYLMPGIFAQTVTFATCPRDLRPDSSAANRWTSRSRSVFSGNR